jgi:hypothetical protein
MQRWYRNGIIAAAGLALILLGGTMVTAGTARSSGLARGRSPIGATSTRPSGVRVADIWSKP